MPIPDYQTIMLPLLRATADGATHSMTQLAEIIAGEFKLTREEQRELIPSGQTTVIANRVGWARTYLKQAGLLAIPERGHVRITDRGKDVLREAPDRIDAKFLLRFEEFQQFRARSRPRSTVKTDENPDEQTPQEALEAAYQALRSDLEEEILEQVKGASPAFFERLVVELLVAMGYGGSLEDAGRAVGRSGDGGIDGIIKEDRLGLDVVFIQAKKWENTVGRPEIQKFAGALQGQRARKGVFITTCGFSREAHDYAKMIDSKIVLIDGAMLASLMADYGIGVSPVAAYQIKKIDMDYFTEG